MAFRHVGELGQPSPDPAVLAGGLQTGTGAFAQHGSFELGKGPNHLHHNASCRRRGADGLGKTAEAGFGLAQTFHDGEHVAQRAREPIEFPDDQNVAFAELIYQAMQFGPGLNALRRLSPGRSVRIPHP